MLPRLSTETMTVPALERLYAEVSLRSAFIPETISAARQLDPDHIWRALWLLRRRAREHPLAPETLRPLCDEADGLTHWVARLMLGQLLSVVGCPAASAEVVFPVLCEWTKDRNAFVRAWALTALARFSTNPDYRREVSTILRHARRDPSKAVQARLRAIAAQQAKTRLLKASPARAGRSLRDGVPRPPANSGKEKARRCVGLGH
ncbi:MAG TPA: hypothetical protein VHF69_09120 [Candidatus Synoicihabitans sp.]|nr:hypothetical protein [Candidatus Synoicihabitans sp.]